MNAEISTSGDLKSGDFFRTSPSPPRPRPNSPMQRPPSLLRISNFFYYDPYPYPYPLPPTPYPLPLPLPPTPYPLPPPFPARPSNFAGKRGFICQGLQLAEYSFNHMLAYIAVAKKKVCCICLQWTTLTTQENEARNRNTSIGSQMILESWNIWSLNLSFLWATDPNFLLSGSLVTRAGDRLRIRESWHLCECNSKNWPIFWESYEIKVTRITANLIGSESSL